MKRTSLTELREKMRGVARGTRRPSPLPVGPLLAALSQDTLGLLRVLLRERPATVAAVVTLTGRARPNVSRSLQVLAKHGLVRLVREGREVDPVPVVSVLRVELATGIYETTAVAR